MEDTMIRRFLLLGFVAFAVWGTFCNFSRAQNINASLSGTITDPTGAAVPSAQLILTAQETGTVSRFTTGVDGVYSFPNLPPGAYELRVSAQGFRDYRQEGILVRVGDFLRQDVALSLGASTQTIDVVANASPLNFDNAQRKEGVNPETMKELPLVVAGGPRSAAGFVNLLPGVTNGGGDVTNAHFNGSVAYSGEALLDGISLEYPSGGNGMFSAFFDFPQSPDMISEIKVLTSNYEPQYGSTGGAIVIMETKSGTNQFHGGVYEYHRNTAFNARQFGADTRPHDLENDFGGFLGGPAKFPLAWSGSHKTFFFFDYERFRIAGGLSRPVLSIPSMKERQGDFSDWVDPSTGSLIPVYDPATLRSNPTFDPSQAVSATNLPYLRDHFMGCNGDTPNVICPSDPRLTNSLAAQWFKYLPTPTSAGPLNNFLAPAVPGTYLSNANFFNLRVDEFIGNSDHVSAVIWHRTLPAITASYLAPQISTNQLTYKHTWANRMNWDHNFGSNVLNNVAFGYTDDYVYQGGIDGTYGSALPAIPGVATHAFPPLMTFSDGFTNYGTGYGPPAAGRWPSPDYVLTDLASWVKGKHTFKFGGEYRNWAFNFHNPGNASGVFNFARSETGLLGPVSGSPIASFLLEQVDNGFAAFHAFGTIYGRADAWIGHFGDTWKVNSKLSVNYGIRWEMHRPPVEKWDRMSFLDPTRPNPGAGNLPGSLVFAGTKWGDASFGARRPDKTFKGGFGPRLGIAYSLSPKTVVRTGYGIFYDSGYYPGWEGGIATDGFDETPAFSSTVGGLSPAFLLSQGLPQNFTPPPLLDPTLLNGQNGPNYRQIDGNRLPYSQQWNLSVEHQFTNDFYVSAGYVGSKATRLLSAIAPMNALDPKLLVSMGPKLQDEFQAGATSVDDVSLPYQGWAGQMSACAPSVAQALLPFPQYCGGLTPINDNSGNSTFHSLQVKAEKRASHGTWLLASYTFSKLITSTDTGQSGALLPIISPFQRERNKGLALEDIPQTLALSLTYELPVGKGRRWLSHSGPADWVFGGWTTSNIFHAQSGIPFTFRWGFCNVPSEFRSVCIPGVLPGASPWAVSKGSFDPEPGKALLNSAAFEPASSFNYYIGQGPRVSNLRGYPYFNHDFAILKDFKVTEKIAFEVRGEFFNIWNWHALSNVGNSALGATPGISAFVTDVSSPDFGQWNGTVTKPRNIQLGARLTF